jgi:hypothetical protein
MMNDNIHEMPIKPDAAKAAVEAMKRNLSAQMEFVEIMMKLRRVAYLSALANGFTNEEALALAMKPFGI